MARGRHHAQAVARTRLPRPLVATGIVTVLLAVALVVIIRAGIGVPAATPGPAARQAGQNVAAEALAITEFRNDERASRSRTGPPRPAPRAASAFLQERAGTFRPTPEPAPKPRPQPRPTPSGGSGAPCPISRDVVQHLTPNARSVYRAVCAAFGSVVSSFGGYRAGDPGDHGSGRAVDIMVSGDPGLAIARYVQTHARELHVTYVIYQQRIWTAGNPTARWKVMADRGSRTANHYDHVHVSVS